MSRPIEEIEQELAEVRHIYRFTGPTHESVDRCERLYRELLEAKETGSADAG